MEPHYEASGRGADASRVTVVVPCFNAAPYVHATLTTVEHQTARGFQVLIFDDGSTDGSDEIGATFATRWPGARAVRRSENRGVCHTLNEALRLVSTDFTIVFSADDLMLPTLVEDALAAIDRLPHEYAAIAFPHLVGDAQARLVRDEHGEPKVEHLPDDVEAAQPGTLLPLLLVANRFPGIALFRTEVLRTLGYDETLRTEDWDLWCRLAAAYRIGVVGWPLFVYRDTPDSLNKRLRLSGQLAVDGAALRAKFVGQSTPIDSAVTERTRMELHILLVGGHREAARDVLRRLRAAGLNERFARERMLLCLPTWVVRRAAGSAQGVRRLGRR
jgi:cellulose synthase/poly-beta-1,6-N-acetylglucosamine synthase-like glycosyltransferase